MFKFRSDETLSHRVPARWVDVEASIRHYNLRGSYMANQMKRTEKEIVFVSRYSTSFSDDRCFVYDEHGRTIVSGIQLRWLKRAEPSTKTFEDFL